MKISELVEKLKTEGFILTVEGEALRVTPSSRLPDEQREAIREHRAEIVAHLAAQTPESHAYTTLTPSVQHRARKGPLTASTPPPERRAITSTDLVKSYRENPIISGAIASRLAELQNAHEPYDFADLCRIIAEENHRITFQGVTDDR